MDKKTVLDELQPFVKVPSPEEAIRTELGLKLAQFIADVVSADLNITQTKALSEARGLSMNDVVLACRVNSALSDFKADARINAKKVEIYKAKDIEARTAATMKYIKDLTKPHDHR